MARFYPIGTPGRPWTAADKAAWFERQRIQRSYDAEVVRQLSRLAGPFVVSRYGALDFDAERYPLFAAKPARPRAGAPWALVTGGVHGYETSGVQGALLFLAQAAVDYVERVNLVVAPCVSPWGYEVIHRWNPYAVDPNRSFVKDSPAQEAALLTRMVRDLGVEFLVHLDLHETTDTDESEFRPALAARDGKPFEPETIPDGFYTVADEANPQPEFQAAIIAGVARVTHIAQPDANGSLIGKQVAQPGVIHYPFATLGLCAGVTGARFTSTTEVYPDSPRVTPQLCNAAQVAAVRAALDHALRAAS
jgi:hypothetical protein